MPRLLPGQYALGLQKAQGTNGNGLGLVIYEGSHKYSEIVKEIFKTHENTKSASAGQSKSSNEWYLSFFVTSVKKMRHTCTCA